MTIESQATEEAILARCQSVLSRFFDTEVPDNVATPAYPYGVLYFSEPIRTAGSRGLCNSQNDPLKVTLRVQVISSTAASLKPVVDRLKKSLVGWEPPDSGMMNLEGGFSFSRSYDGIKPTEYVRDLYMTYVTNLKGN